MRRSWFLRGTEAETKRTGQARLGDGGGQRGLATRLMLARRGRNAQGSCPPCVLCRCDLPVRLVKAVIFDYKRGLHPAVIERASCLAATL
jgi:hypothetical protein